MKKWISGLSLALCLPALASASTLSQVKNGQTSIQLGEALVSALAGCEVSRITQGNYKPGDAKLRFPVTGGALGADGEALVGEAAHGGGVLLACPTEGGETTAALQNLVIDLQEESAEVTGLVTVSDSESLGYLGRVPLFTVGGPDLEVIPHGNGQSLRIRNADLTPTTELVNVLVELLGAVELEGPVARAWSRIQLRKPDKDKGKPDKDDDGEEEEDEGES